MFSQLGFYSLNLKCCLSTFSSHFTFKTLFLHTYMEFSPTNRSRNRRIYDDGYIPKSKPKSQTKCCSLSPSKRTNIDCTLTLQEWQGWGTNSPVPSTVIDAISYLKSVEGQTHALMTFDGNGGRLMVYLSLFPLFSFCFFWDLFVNYFSCLLCLLFSWLLFFDLVFIELWDDFLFICLLFSDFFSLI